MRFQALLLSFGMLVMASGTSTVYCPARLQGVYADMHDGDKKEITISGDSMTIKPSGNDQTWVVKTEVDRETCSANIDFNVPGKLSPPLVNLTATLWYSFSVEGYKSEFEFRDPSGKLAGKEYPLDRWVEVTSPTHKPGRPWVCPPVSQVIFADMHDEDKKIITISGTSVTIEPICNNQTWVVKAQLDRKTCSANIDFNVPGKPGVPPVNLTATLWTTVSTTTGKVAVELEFTDPTGTLAPPTFPLNRWVQLPKLGGEILV